MEKEIWKQYATTRKGAQSIVPSLINSAIYLYDSLDFPTIWEHAELCTRVCQTLYRNKNESLKI